MGIWDVLRRQPPSAHAAGGLKVSRPHCERGAFHKGRALLNTSGMTFLGLDWANKEATTLSRARRGLVQWFAKAPELIPVKTRDPEE